MVYCLTVRHVGGKCNKSLLAKKSQQTQGITG